MEIRNLITFTKVAETQSLSKAAKLLGYAQSTVTMQMQQLEQELGAQLYERVGKQIRITQTGQEFLSYAAAIVRMSEDALKVGKQNTSAITGSLRLGISGQLSCERLSSRIARYLQDYPQVDVNVQVIAEPEELLFRLRHNDIDLALTLDLLCTDTDLIHAAKDLPAPLHAFAAKGHPLAGQTGLSGEELSHYPLICTGHFEAGLDHKLHAPGSGQIRISDTALALSIAADSSRAAGSAPVILVPDLIVRIHPAAQKLVRLDYEPSASPFWLQVLCHRNKWLTGAMKAWLADSEDPVFSL